MVLSKIGKLESHDLDEAWVSTVQGVLGGIVNGRWWAFKIGDPAW
jgi:hypothetical protein